ncbi:unnamed protein product [Mytilus edulis]|uniref:Uncharacterized protein n=1 Tax=Mytilus edulis TaxID=6550 RepID=A0A8S3S054_MYTED|nr:unnamed protein product [Mytilus edulis]
MLDVLRYQNEMTGRKRDIPLVAGIAIGTTYSGDAFSTRDTYKIDPLKIHANPIWKADGRSYLSLKIPTCLLLNTNKEFDSFGYEAENKYAELVMNGQQDDYYYFHRFQMKIRNIQSVKGDMVLMDINGKPAPAVEVYAHSIRALVNHLMYTLPQGTGVKSNDIQLVITVPGTCNWTEYIKEFTRKSAEKAGIQQDNLLILKEPEAAFIYCQHLPTEKLSGAKHGFSMSKVGSRYIIVDLGGATFDVAVIEKLTGDGIKEVCRYPIKGGCAATSIDTEFIQLFGNIFGEPFLSTMKGKHPLAYLDLLREFEAVKMTMTSTKTKDINIKLPYCTLDSLCKQYFERDVTSTVMDSSYASLISIRGDKMRLDNKLFHGLFDKTIKSILDILKFMFKRENRQTDTVLLLVGSFSECPLVQEAIRKAFPFNQKTNDSDNDVQEIVGLPKHFDVNRLDLKRSMPPSHFDSRVSDIDEQAKVELFEYVDIQKIDFTKRSPPSLFEEDRISDSAKDTCNSGRICYDCVPKYFV